MKIIKKLENIHDFSASREGIEELKLKNENHLQYATIIKLLDKVLATKFRAKNKESSVIRCVRNSRQSDTVNNRILTLSHDFESAFVIHVDFDLVFRLCTNILR